MALLSIPRPLFLLSLAPHIGSSSRTRRHPCSCSLSLQQPTRRLQKSDAGSAILWFKQDLRVDDHPGLVQAAKFPSLVPLYVFDHQILSRYSDEMLELVLFALEDLRLSLKEQGSNLMIRFGNAENVIKDLVLKVKGTDVFAEEEVEYHLRQMLDVVEETLVKTPSGTAKIVLWRTPFYDIKNLKELSSSYEEFMKLKLPVTSPVVAPTLPGANMELDWGIIPTLDELKKFVNDNPTKLKESWSSIRDLSTESILLKKLAKSRGNNLSNKSSVPIQRKRPQNTVFVTSKGNVVGGGTSKILNGLAAYLRYLEGTGRDDWQELHEKLRNAEVKEGASFLQLFGPALNLGIISKRRVHYETIKYEKERNGGFLSPFGYSTANVAAVADAVCSTEWYRLLGLKSQISDEVKYPIRIWRWNGYLIQYTVAGSEGPATLLVHGFGAFLEHYRDNIHNISEGRNRVWAITVLGFGKSEKPNVVYTELMWAELLRDFVIEVVGEPVHLVGNSIGGMLQVLA
ncbi:hypothetical protein Tsubulata_022862 [Turnera subulata]|uniref:Photolyase/cryptochrome alpha/beta domain-containing protein n=1 Tax=Turnera subulata TaxID=218843 RepID=A0A9Q0FCV0_9ROSI|nr:hypothetical protein Tsubulata_022862 [Turnera subulata]